VPLGIFYGFARISVFATTTGGHTDVRHRLTGGQVADFRIAAAIADQNDFIDGCHGFLQISR
jgi:hypothetical protein